MELAKGESDLCEAEEEMDWSKTCRRGRWTAKASWDMWEEHFGGAGDGDRLQMTRSARKREAGTGTGCSGGSSREMASDAKQSKVCPMRAHFAFRGIRECILGGPP